jgi:hypothetical protein
MVLDSVLTTGRLLFDARLMRTRTHRFGYLFSLVDHEGRSCVTRGNTTGTAYCYSLLYDDTFVSSIQCMYISPYVYVGFVPVGYGINGSYVRRQYSTCTSTLLVPLDSWISRCRVSPDKRRGPIASRIVVHHTFDLSITASLEIGRILSSTHYTYR